MGAHMPKGSPGVPPACRHTSVHGARGLMRRRCCCRSQLPDLPPSSLPDKMNDPSLAPVSSTGITKHFAKKQDVLRTPVPGARLGGLHHKQSTEHFTSPGGRASFLAPDKPTQTRTKTRACEAIDTRTLLPPRAGAPSCSHPSFARVCARHLHTHHIAFCHLVAF